MGDRKSTDADDAPQNLKICEISLPPRPLRAQQSLRVVAGVAAQRAERYLPLQVTTMRPHPLSVVSRERECVYRLFESMFNISSHLQPPVISTILLYPSCLVAEKSGRNLAVGCTIRMFYQPAIAVCVITEAHPRFRGFECRAQVCCNM